MGLIDSVAEMNHSDKEINLAKNGFGLAYGSRVQSTSARECLQG